MLGSGKSSLAWYINKKYGLPRLNLDDIFRTPDGGYTPPDKYKRDLDSFLNTYTDWVIEGCQRELYEHIYPDIVIVTDISGIRAAWRFTRRFFQAKRLIGQTVDTDAPVQAYHYRRPTPAKIWDWYCCNRVIHQQITDWLKVISVPVITVSSFREYSKIDRILIKERFNPLSSIQPPLKTSPRTNR